MTREKKEPAKVANTDATLVQPAEQNQSPSPPILKPDTARVDEHTNKKIKELEQAFFAFKFYPVAVKDAEKEDAIRHIIDLYKKEDETIRQLILYMVHEALSQSADLKTMYNFDFYKRKAPTADTAQVRMNVYRAMFNYHFSLEGLFELVRLLGRLPGDDAAKVLSYHLSYLLVIEVEGTHMLRNVIIETLGDCESEYALRCLLDYAKYTDNERMLQRIASALVKWTEKIDHLKMPAREKSVLKTKLEQVLTLEFGDTHYR